MVIPVSRTPNIIPLFTTPHPTYPKLGLFLDSSPAFAARIVVDVGLQAKRWRREEKDEQKLVQYFSSANANAARTPSSHLENIISRCHGGL